MNNFKLLTFNYSWHIPYINTHSPYHIKRECLRKRRHSLLYQLQKAYFFLASFASAFSACFSARVITIDAIGIRGEFISSILSAGMS